VIAVPAVSAAQFLRENHQENKRRLAAKTAAAYQQSLIGACWFCGATVYAYARWSGGFECDCGCRWLAEPVADDAWAAHLADRRALAARYDADWIDHGARHVPSPA
jgi:hypothetical protein